MKIVIASSLCRDCQTCTLACSLFHHDECSLELARLRAKKDFTSGNIEIILCRQCDFPDCIAACPNEAIRLAENKQVILFVEECLQCGACAEACPYRAIFYSQQLGIYLKCDLCRGRASSPVCVELCPVGALTLAAEEG